MTYYVGNDNIAAMLGEGNSRYFYALRRTEGGDLYFCRIDQISGEEQIIINNPGLTENNYEDFEYGVDFFDGRLEQDHSRPYANLQWDQYRWDNKSVYCYIDANGEFVVRVNRPYSYT
jgi:hypothetical protein